MAQKPLFEPCKLSIMSIIPLPNEQKEQVIMIGDDIQITVVDIRGDKIRLGIDAPRKIPVHRKEVYDAIRKENATKDTSGC